MQHKWRAAILNSSPSSVSSESCFSMTGAIATPRRDSLSSSLFKKLVFLRDELWALPCQCLRCLLTHDTFGRSLPRTGLRLASTVPLFPGGKSRLGSFCGERWDPSPQKIAKNLAFPQNRKKSDFFASTAMCLLASEKTINLSDLSF